MRRLTAPSVAAIQDCWDSGASKDQSHVLAKEIEAGRQNTNDSDTLAIKKEFLRKDFLIASKLTLPEIVT